MSPVPQPAKAVLAMRRISNREVAAALGISAQYLGRVLNGYVEPSARLRAEVAAFLSRPESKLFRDRRPESAW